MTSLYDGDILAWSEQQSALLRRIAAGERVNGADLDWPDIIEEIESVGREQLHAVESLLIQTLIHVLKSQAWPDSGEVPHWQAEARLFQGQAALRFAPSMRQRIDLDRLYKIALRGLPGSIDGLPPQPVPAVCPFALDDLLDGS
jgi:hypothetical protein